MKQHEESMAGEEKKKDNDTMRTWWRKVSGCNLTCRYVVGESPAVAGVVGIQLSSWTPPCTMLSFTVAFSKCHMSKRHRMWLERVVNAGRCVLFLQQRAGVHFSALAVDVAAVAWLVNRLLHGGSKEICRVFFFLFISHGFFFLSFLTFCQTAKVTSPQLKHITTILIEGFF